MNQDSILVNVSVFLSRNTGMGLDRIVEVIQDWAQISPVRAKCACGSSIWVSEKSSAWLVQTFVLGHAECEGILLQTGNESEEEADFLRLVLASHRKGSA